MIDESKPEVAPEAEDLLRKRLKRRWKIVALPLMLIIPIFGAYSYFMLWPKILAKAGEAWCTQVITYDEREGKCYVYPNGCKVPSQGHEVNCENPREKT